MAFNKDQFRGLIVDVLREADLYSPSAVELLMLTCAVESDFGTYIEQITGPALGVFQMEPNTHNDIWDNYLKYRSNRVYWDVNNDVESLRYDMKYAIYMARLHYLRVPEPLPNATNVEALARYWKKYYNTEKGKGRVDNAIQKYKEYCV